MGLLGKIAAQTKQIIAKNQGASPARSHNGNVARGVPKSTGGVVSGGAKVGRVVNRAFRSNSGMSKMAKSVKSKNIFGS